MQFRIASFVASMVVIVLLILVVTVEPVKGWAGPSKIVSSTSAPLDWCPGDAAICQDNRRLTTLAAGTPVTMVCWIDKRIPAGYTYGRWFYVTIGSDQGFVKAELVTNQNPSSPWCLDNGNQQRRAIAASLRATDTAEIYQAFPTATDKANARSVYGFSSWGPYADWSGDCVMFTGLAWWGAGQKIHSGANAAAIARTYALQGGTPPRGAAVFWDWSRVGHVAISLGNNMVVTTRGMDNDRLNTTDATIESITLGKTLLGWTPTP